MADAKLSIVKQALPDSVFGVKLNRATAHQGLVRQQANARRGTQKTKARGEVRGGGTKPWKQKGTGRARAGSRRSPLWRGGAMIHAIGPRDYTQHMPRNMRREALRSVLAERAREGAVTVVDSIDLPEPKTRLVEGFLDQLETRTALFVVVEPSRNLLLGARNLPEAKVVTLDTINVEDFIRFEKLVFTRDALGKLEETLGKAGA